MNVRNCRKCKKLFNYINGDPICPSCKAELEDKFKIVKEFIWNHKNASIEETAEECGVSASDIKKWLREGRLELTEGSSMRLECKGCGKQIRSGNLCNFCAKSLGNDFSNTALKMRSEMIAREESEHHGYFIQ